MPRLQAGPKGIKKRGTSRIKPASEFKKRTSMTILLFLLVFLGFYSLYSTSKRAKLNNTKIDLWLQDHTKISKLSGALFLIAAFGLSVILYGIGAGIFVALILLMTIGSLIVALSPLLLKKQHNACK